MPLQCNLRWRVIISVPTATAAIEFCAMRACHDGISTASDTCHGHGEWLMGAPVSGKQTGHSITFRTVPPKSIPGQSPLVWIRLASPHHVLRHVEYFVHCGHTCLGGPHTGRGLGSELHWGSRCTVIPSIPTRAESVGVPRNHPPFSPPFAGGERLAGGGGG